jgi:site-specific DNA-methyltransferase (adenine-specific)
MNLVFEDSTLKLFNNNFLDIIHTLKFDYIITDPPYNVNYKYPDYKDNMTEEKYIEMLSELNEYPICMIHYAEEFCGCVGEALGRPNKCVTWCYSSNLKRQSRMIAWFNCMPDFNKVKQPYKDITDKRIKKRIEDGSEGARLYDWWDDIQLIKTGSKDKIKSFTNQIPVPLLERIIKLTTNENDTILDPFFGSGSIYTACKNTNRKCIGIEQSKVHLESFFERIK